MATTLQRRENFDSVIVGRHESSVCACMRVFVCACVRVCEKEREGGGERERERVQ